MKKIIFFIILFLFSFTEIIYSIDTVSTKYYPLNVGNSWTCTYFHNIPPMIYQFKKTITGTVIQNGHKYYLINTTLFRIDSTNGRLLNYVVNSGCNWSINEKLIDSLSARKGDSCIYNCSTLKSICTDTSNVNIFGLNRPSKVFTVTGFEIFFQTRYVKGIGMTYYIDWSGSGTQYTTYTLNGCVIDGIVYGDTTITGIKSNSTEISADFRLSQNYPNPFNPSTTIEFDIPNRSFVTLSLYDITGREVETLVNELVPPGRYRVLWNAENYSSGVYFYKLTTADFSVTKRMVLVK
ncbi:MAG: T9SS C-terminal target domain-containing protein [Ignavibacteriae bacterium]|nr:MAG: T9SS C-terminal target domain-containing protein [Ignavibacteriota bacterium]